MPRIFTVGTLKYTTAGMLMLCVSLLWGDFIFFLLDQDLPHIFPLKLKEMGAGDRTIMLLLKTIPSAMVFLIAPAISFHSDRHRGRWGRRIPYLVWSTPLVGLCMVLIGCHDDLAAFFVGNADSVSVLGLSYSRAAVSLFLLCAMIVVFTFVNIFTNTIYWYLFNDIVPKEFMTRFMALFRIVMYLASMLYNRYILPDSLAHFRLLFIAGGIVYTVGFLLMFLLVREGKYPPPPPLVMESAKWGEIWSTFVGVVARKWEQVRGYSRQRAAVVLFLAFLVLLPVSGLGLMMAVLCLVGCGLEYATLGLGSWLGWQLRGGGPGEYRPYVSGVSRRFAGLTTNAITYAKECFTHRFYWYFFLGSIFNVISWTSSGPYRLLRDRDSLGLSLKDIGEVGFWAGLVSACCMFPFGWLADKFNPVRVNMLAMLGPLVSLAAQSVYAIHDFGPTGNLTYFYVLTLTGVATYGIGSVTATPAAMILLPKERYGQFMSANAMLCALATIVGTFGAGEFMGYLETHTQMGLWRYRLYPFWTLVFQVPSVFFMFLVYREWKRRGGAKNYTPPET